MMISSMGSVVAVVVGILWTGESQIAWWNVNVFELRTIIILLI